MIFFTAEGAEHTEEEWEGGNRRFVSALVALSACIFVKKYRDIEK
jgi:hypothetical protein